MATAAPAITNFTSGELSPLMRGRVDLAEYFNGCDTLQNMVVLPHGPALRRSGTYFAAAAKDHNNKSRLMAFEFNASQSYCLEWAGTALRFFSYSGAQFTAADHGSAISNGTFASNIAGWTDRSTAGSIAHTATGGGRLNLLGAAGGYAWAEQSVTIAAGDQAKQHVLRFEIPVATPAVNGGGVAGDEIEVRIGTTSTGAELVNDVVYPGFHSVAFTPNTSPVYVQFRNGRAKNVHIDNVRFLDNEALEIGSPYAVADLFAIRAEQSADVLFLCCGQGGNNSLGYHPYQLLRESDVDWSLQLLDILDGPYNPENTTAVTMTRSAASGLGITITASAATFSSTDIGRVIAVKDGSTWGWARITGFTSSTVVTADVRATFGATAAVATWKLGKWSDTQGWPVCCELHEQRLFFAGGAVDPAEFDGSETGDYTSFTPGTTASDPISAAIGTGGVNRVRWLSSATSVLLVGTEDAEHRVGTPGTATQEPLTPSNIPQKQQAPHGSVLDVEPVRVGDRSVFVQRRARKVRAIGYQAEPNAFVADDISVLSEHITKSGVTALAYQKEPHSIVWALRDDGVLLSCTYQPGRRLAGWARHVLGGSFGSGAAVVESIAVITAPTGDDQLWLAVKRTINGATKRYVESLQDFDNPEIAVTDCFFVDAGLTYSGVAVTSLSGLDHLEGQTVQILANGAAHPNKTVASGAIALDFAATKAHVGLGFTPDLIPVRLEAGATQGTAQGKPKRIDTITVRFNRTIGAKYGPNTGVDADLKTLPFREPDDPMDAGLPLFTGDKEVDFQGDWEFLGQVRITHDQPLPLCVVGLYPHVIVSEV